ncbi:DUF4267 domain-containing protein [Stackebrandtia nassauensis]|uniref:Uncharacterized protein n=1 Tax=Stackebrandtia nassauensis (strain DSM 44728 / CIP 108903 / NRRL B-16338 / NBRC 102104 / LLR-40K-21) TaxID=446470 RepID=D3PZH3_STANL|nr:DUF4267 domain-containing protein [Stackebrandtia nassauensis]ADD41647.1 hypothetical protein Snas_1951 [Stackebrandtia nassauensis DSM 44728]
MIQALNDSNSERKWSRTIRVVNAVLAAGTAAFAVAALIHPPLAVAGTVTDSTTFYVQIYAARAIPLGLAVAVLALSRNRRALPALLLVAGVVQLADVVIGVSQANPGMTITAVIAAAVPLWSAWYLRAERGSRRALGVT